jgi:hypothetical protein
MLKHLLSLRRHAPRTATDVTDRRSGPPLRRELDPLPRMRWYT